MLAVGQASVLRGAWWKGIRRGKREGEERRGPPRVTQAHSRSSGRKLSRRPAHVGTLCSDITPVAHSPPEHVSIPLFRSLQPPSRCPSRGSSGMRVSAATSTLTRQPSHPSTAGAHRGDACHMDWGTVAGVSWESTPMSPSRTPPPASLFAENADSALLSGQHRQHPIAVPHYTLLDPHYERRVPWFVRCRMDRQASGIVLLVVAR